MLFFSSDFPIFRNRLQVRMYGQEMQRVKNNRGRESEHATEQKSFHLIQVCFLLLNLKDHDLQNKYSDIKPEIRTMSTPL